MSKTKILSLAVLMATLAFTGLSASCHKSSCGKTWKDSKSSKKDNKPSKKPLATVEDLKDRAKSYDAAYKTFMDQEAGKAVLESRNTLKESVANSSLSCKDIFKAVKKALPGKKKEADAAQKQAKKDMKRLLESICEKREPVANGQCDVNCVTKAATAYFDSMVRATKECPEAYAQFRIARFSFAKVLKSLLKQGMKSEDLAKELEAAGISNSYLLGKSAKSA
ncbi:MAG: hypothetical protein LLG04_10290 [Parachlamydia sp.]|nr:hypothetical protein [Parachlamydia sp.]